MVKAPANGYVRGLEVKVGQSVQDGIKLFALEVSLLFLRFLDFVLYLMYKCLIEHFKHREQAPGCYGFFNILGIKQK